MKQLYIVLLLLFSAHAFCQPEKDALLEADNLKVDEMITMAQYLDRCAANYFIKPAEEKANMGFSRYYREIVIGYSTVPSFNIPEYLGYKDGAEPLNNDAFMDAVYSTNIEMLLTVTDKYGYPSCERMRAGAFKKATCGSMIFIMRSDAYDKKLKAIFKRENKLGNLSDKEYNHFKFIMKRKKMITDADIEWLEKNAGVKMRITDNVKL